ncbi:unnamed protein product [Rotaria sordida]|uniref:Syndecan n=1 Tax=Rotaria sordida TaxID=392033 RepID=A0A814DV48_9BILA|nr:unnamed protein product [Rotaria sordida]CAF0960069.1 unnamed protein product [Rotaria sordida]CAF1048434.1 unnamed protein product [Rotaria sordida]CAF1055887.1 unnamed protein product [Rotaria sordida]CAF3574715.1 unnamed protein product [Rotaria sordida]
MFIRLWVTSILLIIVVQSAVTNSSKGQIADNSKLLKQDPLDYDYDLNDQKLLGNTIEGSGGAASLDEYADDDEEEELSKITANIISSSSTSTISTTTMTTTTTKSTAIKTTTTTTILLTPWMKTTFNYEQRNEKNRTISTTTLSTFSDLDASEFKDDNEEYADDLEDDAYYNEFTVTNKISTTTYSTTRYLTPTTRQSLVVNHTAPIWILFKFLTRPPIAAGILAGLAIGIFTSVILLICIIQRYHKREKSHSSYTTGLLYPNQYGYSKSPQEFYA